MGGDGDPLADEQDLREALTVHLRSRLPAHMLPAHLVCLEALPLAQKSAFLLHHEDGLALDEMARALALALTFTLAASTCRMICRNANRVSTPKTITVKAFNTTM